jgi:hypothetical protein
MLRQQGLDRLDEAFVEVQREKCEKDQNSAPGEKTLKQLFSEQRHLMSVNFSIETRQGKRLVKM